MKRVKLFLLTALAVCLTGSCSNYYESYPEGYVANSAPVGYALVTIAGITYWCNNSHNHYYRYWPGYGYVVVRPPHNRPPYHRPPVRPVPPIAKPPGNRPPGGKPPGTRPPNSRPPSIQPLPNTRPVSRPVSRPSIQPSRPSMPSTRPMPRARARR